MSETAPETEALAGRLAELRPELHRYCARILGSVIDGEDIVHDVMLKALGLGGAEAPANLRAWLFRAAHNRALDVVRSRRVRQAEPIEQALDVADEATTDPQSALVRRETVSLAVDRFLDLPPTQRSVLVLKDVLDQSLAEIGALLDLSADAVKAHLARGRARLRQLLTEPTATGLPDRPSPQAQHYAGLFNRRDWDELRRLLADDVKLSQAQRPVRQGLADVGQFFTFYDRYEPVRLVPGWLEGREVLAVFQGEAATPAYFMWLEWRDGRIVHIHDYRYAAYVLEGADLRLASA